MKYRREDYLDFLSSEYDTQMGEYNRLIATKAIILKERGEVFVGKFLGFKDDFAIFKVRVTDNMPRKNSFWTASSFIGEMGSYKNWGHLSWAELREKYQSEYSDTYCAWLAKDKDSDFCLVGMKNITVDFANLLREQCPIIAFGPKDPPLRYLLNLQEVVQDNTCEHTRDILDYQEVDHSIWKPTIISTEDDFISLITRELSTQNAIIIQGPPGTGKTNKIARLIAQLLKDRRSVLATSLTNEALKELASKKDLETALQEGRVTKTGLTIDEKKEVPHLISNEGNVCNATQGCLTLATFFISSGWATNSYGEQPFDYVIVDEASQALLPMIAASKKLGKKVIWVGDQRQLAPIVTLNEDIINRNGWISIIKGFNTICNNVPMPAYMLSDTYRLTKRGAAITGVFYNNRLKSASDTDSITSNLAEVNPLGGPVFIDMELKIGDQKPSNAFERIYNMAIALLQENPQLKIALLSKFRETVKELQRFFIKTDNDLSNNLKIETVDRIQGITVDYTFFLIPNTSVSYSLEREFFNVATSRAKLCTFIIADKHILRNYMSEDVRKFLLKTNENKVAVFEGDNTQTLSAGDIKVSILNKIDLPERKLKEIVDGKENIFIIDTNVFVKCPTVIYKIGKYPIVIPTMVIEELDRLKLKPSIDQKALSDAVKSINKSFLNRFAKMDEGNTSLLPKGFDATKADCLILSVALKYQGEGKNPILLTSDNLLQSKALGIGITTISLKDFLAERR